MKTFLPKSGLLTLVFLITNLFFASVAFGQATVSTDLLDYPPGSTAIITGSGFQAGETVILLVEHVGEEPMGTDPQYHQPWIVVANSIGNIATSWYVPTVEEGDALGATFLLTADGMTSLLHAEATFTDANYTFNATGLTGTPPIIVAYRVYTTSTGPTGIFLTNTFNYPGPSTSIAASSSQTIEYSYSSVTISGLVYNAPGGTQVGANGNGGNTITSAYCTVPIISSQPTSSSVTYGTNATFSVVTTGSSPFTYQWQEFISSWNPITNVGIYSNATTSTLTLATPSVSISGRKYRCIITNGCGNVTTDGNATVNIIKANQTISWATPAAITYGTLLSATQLNATAQGTLTYTPASGTLLNAGSNQVLSVSASATANHEAAGPTTVLINVNKANQTITWANPTAISYGTLLSATQLNATVAGSATAGASAPGALTYTPASVTLLNAGSQTLQVDAALTSNYNAATKQVTLIVNKANQIISWSNPLDITYGTALSSTQLNATVAGVAGGSAPGALTYSPLSGTILNAGLNQTLSVSATLTPDYNAAGPTTAQINVNKANQSITLGNLTQSYDGTAKPVTATTSPIGGLNVVSITYNGSATLPINAGSYAVVATLTNGNYQAVNATGTLVINKATPTFTNLSGSQSITFGTSSVSLAGTINGSTEPTGTITATINGAAQNTTRGTGSNTANFSFNYPTASLGVASSPYTISYSYPGDTNFEAITDVTKTVTVNKATATISLSNLSQIYNGTPKSATATTSPSLLTVVSITYDGSATPPTNAGSYAVIASLNNANYQATNATGTLVIAKATATLTLDTATLNQTYDGSAKVVTATTNPSGLGAISLTYNGLPAPPTNAGSYPIVASLTNANYQATNTTGTLLVSKATPAFSNLTASQSISYGTSLITLSGKITAGTLIPTGSVSVTVDGTGQTGTINSSDGTFSLIVNTSSITASATPYSINYNYTATVNFSAKLDNSTSLTVNKASATITLGSLSQTYDGTAKAATATTSPTGLNTVNISYSQSGSAVISPTNAGNYDVTGTLTNTNYTASTATGTLIINKATPSFSAITASQSITYATSAITLSGKISAGSSIPTGSIIISINGVSSSVAIKQTGGSNVVGTFNLIFNTSLINASAIPYIIKYEYNGDNNFGLIQDISTAVTVNKAAAVITVNPYSVTYDSLAHTSTFTAVGVETIPVDLTGLITVTGTMHTNAATYNGDAWSFAGNTNYAATSGTVNNAIGKATTVTAVTIAAGPFAYTGVALIPATVTVTGPGSLSLTPTANYVNNTNAGVATASYKYAGDDNYLTSTDSKNFTIGKAATITTVTVPAGPYAYTGVAQTPATVTVTGPGSLSLTPTANYVNNTNAGVATASYTYAGDDNYLTSTDSKNFTIGKAATITTVTVPAGPFAYTGVAQIPATVTVTGPGSLSLTPTANYVNNTNAGAATASYTYAGDDNYLTSTDSKNFTIGKAATITTVTVPAGPYAYTGVAQTPATVTVTGPGSLSLTPTANYVNNTNAGVATASYTYAGDDNYLTSTDSKNFTIGKAATITTVTVPAGPFAYTGVAQTPATVTVTGPGSLSLTPTANYLNNTNAGVATASYTYAGDDNYLTSTDSKNFTIGKAATITTVTVPAGPYAYTGVAQIPATVTVTGPGSLSLTPTANYVNNTNAGAATASYTYAGDDNYLTSTDSKNFTIGKAATITTVTVPAGPFAYTGVAQIPATVTVTGPGSLSLTPTANYVNNTNAGVATASYTYAGDDNYLTSTDSKNFTIGKAATITTVTVPAGPFAYTGVAQIPATVTVTGPGSLSLTPTSNYVNNTNAGVATASHTYAGDDNYLTSTDSKNFTIGKAATITTVTVPAGPFAYTGVAQIPVTVTVTGPGSLSLTPTANYVNNTNAGVATASYTYAGDDNYLTSTDSRNFTIGKKTASVTPSAGQTKVYGSVDPKLTGSTSGFVSTDNVVATYSRLAGETVVGSPYAISAVLTPAVVLNNYTITYNTANFAITPLAVTVTANSGQSKVYGSVNPAAYTYTSAPAVGSALANGESISFTGALSRVSGENVGSYAITQGALDNTNYSISYIGSNFLITQRPITITVNSGQTKTYGTLDPLPFTYVVGGSGLAASDEFTGALTRVTGETVLGSPYAISQGSFTIRNSTTLSSAYSNYNPTVIGANFTITQASNTLTLTLSGSQVRYMDNVTFTAIIKPLNTATPLTGTVTFTIGGINYPALTNATVVPIPGSIDGSVQAMVIMQLPAAVMPSTTAYDVKATFTSTNSNYASGANQTKTIRVDARNASPYNASGFYTGTGFAWTTGPSTSTATVTLSAVIKDLNSPSGDVRGSKVSFFLLSGGTLTPISSAQNLPVGLIDVTDGSVGAASAIAQLNIGSLNSQSFQIAVKVTGAYTNNPYDALSQSIVTVSKPVTGGFITGGSSLKNQNSSGYIKGASGINTDYQFDIQYNSSGTNPKGKVNIMVRSYYDRTGILDSKLHTYFIRTNAIALLAVSNPLATGTFSAKANMEEQLIDGTMVSVESGATFEMVAFQNACNQQIAITYYRKAGGIWFSSNWNAITAKTALQAVNTGSSVYVSGGGTSTTPTTSARGGEMVASVETTAVKSPVVTVEKELSELEPFSITAYPNPSAHYFSIEGRGGSTEKTEVFVFDMLGRMVKHIATNDGQEIKFGEELPSGSYIAIVSQGSNQKTLRLIKQ
ncbi:MBG domain-containing protein [Flavobacterium sp. LS2P90]|uniref:MBG domain-containing protein n=1 Tax=Flavobacterium xylosi TaxID=3230415 RepID=A0ABW6HTN9_9FLAO